MELVFPVYAGLVGLFFGSFATVLISRWRTNEGGIVLGRSHCVDCGHRLRWFELLPIFSFLFLGGKCGNCKRKISYFYPIAEGTMGLIFFLITFAYLKYIDLFSVYGFVSLLTFAFVTGVYVLSDLRYMEIPDEIMVPGIYGVLGVLLGGFFVSDLHLYLFDRATYPGTYSEYFIDHLKGAWILYTFLYIQILLPASFWLIRERRYRTLGELALSYFTFPFLLPFQWKSKEKEPEDEKPIHTWVGGGDLRIAIFIGLTLGTIHGVASFAIAYIAGSIISIIYLLRRKGEGHEIAFGPFLAIGWCMSILFYGDILRYLEYYTLGL